MVSVSHFYGASGGPTRLDSYPVLVHFHLLANQIFSVRPQILKYIGLSGLIFRFKLYIRLMLSGYILSFKLLSVVQTQKPSSMCPFVGLETNPSVYYSLTLGYIFFSILSVSSVIKFLWVSYDIFCLECQIL